MSTKKGTAILDGAFEVLYVVPGVIGWKRGYVDLSKVSVSEAEKLVKEGFPYLKKMEKKAKLEKEDNG